ncbi:glyoxylase-like metal-dependent hydrolase (beta-lactamase superfamily II) [Paenibacillus sp. BK033]|uniref:MBL fold metallo-hydrolase n=1 Tax=Paenibacillus sp. BK033 TaxID=2512133 RepID=UPI001042E01F|nr:MBL fold metallo-hydrolase [Paenibacillus sp. BK033]TCM97839.1 glyoxylase-like metal-dependent hydrolase (beta-lactamase superfamily II) [Paenibacillus sp. BK033]
MKAQLAMLSISAPVMGAIDTVHPVLIWDDQHQILLDTGYPAQLPQLHAAIEAAGGRPGKLTHIILTHQDIDHIGNLPELTSGAGLEVSAHPLEKPYIQGDKRLIRFTDEAIASIDRMPDSVPESFRNGLKRLMLNPPRAAVDREVNGGELLPLAGGITVIDTPGHTPGHISLYHEPSRTLIAGDALMVRDGELYGADPATTLDPSTAQASLAGLLDFDIQTVICYHGGLYNRRVMERLAELAAQK